MKLTTENVHILQNGKLYMARRDDSGHVILYECSEMSFQDFGQFLGEIINKQTKE